ncbi:CATRA conflict system CASPASE/TPR repeat-associated protein [Micromonospora schwarzwaldensis]|uniref:CATRA conflict system CASPASE/TPR repeat-associated protein n=1 Tax=Micromonospora sp. DSM 45708 TaxID=3111767 RepID=UPI0031D1889E
MRLHAYALNAYTFFDGLRDTGVATRIVAACRALGMAEPDRVPLVHADGLRARQLLTAPGDGTWQALRYATTRLDAFLVCLAPVDGAADWRELDRTWREAVGAAADEDCTGRVRLFYALYDGAGDADQLAVAAEAALPAGANIRGEEPTEPVPGTYLWEVPSPDPDRPERVLVLLAPTAGETLSDSWVWPDGDARLRPLPGYLWEMAKVRHEARRFAERRSQDRQARLYDLASHVEDSERTDPEPTEAREERLRKLRRETALGAADEADLRIMSRTVTAEEHNARIWLRDWAGTLAVPDRHAWVEGLAGPVAADLEYVAWLLTEIDDAADTARYTVAYAEPMAQIGAADLERRLRALAERNEFLTALHTSVLAAVGLLLAASQSLSYDWPMYASLRAPFIVSVAAGGLLLLLATTLRSTRRFWVGLATAGFAASLTWFVVTWLVRWQTARPPEASVTRGWSAAAAAAALAGWLGRRAIRSRRELR